MPPRRSHTKSRSGCGKCKKRRIKCDEVHPSCGNCIKHGIECDFALLPLSPPKWTPQASVSVSPSPPIQVTLSSHAYSPGAMAHGRHEPYEAATTSPPLRSTAVRQVHHRGNDGGQLRPPAMIDYNPHSLQVLPTSEIRDPTSSGLDMVDMELLHHFCTETYHTFTNACNPNHNDIILVWQKTVPKLAFQAEFCMHALLAVASLHKHIIDKVDKGDVPSSDSGKADGDESLPKHAKNDWLLIAAQHHEKFVSQMAIALSAISKDNCHALFASSALAVIYAMAIHSPDMMGVDGGNMRSPPPSPSSTVSCTPRLQSTNWFPMIRGVHSILTEVWHWVENGPMSPLLKVNRDISPGTLNAYLADDEKAAHEAVSSLFGLCTPSTKIPFPEELDDTEVSTIYYSAIHELQKTFVRYLIPLISSSLDEPKKQKTKAATIFMWPIAVHDRFVELLDRGQPRALVILAHYFAIMRHVDGYWWLRGRAKWEVLRIRDTIGEEWAEWMKWPVSWVS
ncbi:hypothetical protein RUND412_007916 [Rhizina undulata]